MGGARPRGRREFVSVLISGGVKSGKSNHALRIAREWNGRKYFLATAVAFDDEMKEKIEKHREARGAQFETIEEPVLIDKHVHDRLVLDCVTLWMNNLFFQGIEQRWEEILKDFLDRMFHDTVIVTNETGLGNIPADSVSRRYNNSLGNANKMIAEIVDEVYFMVSGIPVKIK